MDQQQVTKTNKVVPKPFQLSSEGLAFVQKEMQRYETKLSATIPCLYKLQEENGGWISEQAIDHLAEVMMELPVSQLEEVFQFYTMFNKKPVGKYHVQVCCNITCSLLQGRELLQKMLETYSTKEGKITNDGKFTFTRVECLGSCGTAPMMQINDGYVENLTVDSALEHLKGLD